jgi:hypothetical protein
MLLSSPACGHAWRLFTAKRFSFIGFVSVSIATQCSSSAHTAIEGIAIAAPHAAIKPVGNSGGRPTGGTNSARKGGSIIATASRSTGVAAVKNKPA